MGLLRTLDPGTMGGDEGHAAFLGAMLAVTLGGIFVISALIGIINTGIEGRLAELRKGRSRVIETGHTVILGWSQQVFTILAELIGANANQRRRQRRRPRRRDKVEMEDEIRDARPGHDGGTHDRLPLRAARSTSTSSTSPSVQRSRSIIVLAPEVDEPDIEVIKTMLAITNDPNRRPEPYHIVAEIRDPRNLEVARLVGKDEVELVLVGDAHRRASSPRPAARPGLSIVYTRAARLRRRRDLLQRAAGARRPDLRRRAAGLRGLDAHRARRARTAASHLNPPMDDRHRRRGPADR